MKKKKILYQSDFSLLKTGFGRIAKTVLSYLYKTGKYDIVHYCSGTSVMEPELKKTPWKSIGCLPTSQKEIEEINKDPHFQRQAQYGAYYLDKIMKEEKPDIYFGVQDIWGVDFSINKKWFDEIHSVIWTTLDSLPILPTAVEAAKKVKNYWIWSSFAANKLNEMGFDHVKTMHGPIEHDDFYRLPEERRAELRNQFNIDADTFVIGFVFRNQLRKSVPNLLEGYKMLKEEHPDSKTKLLLHTHFAEGWNILKLAEEHGIDKEDIITTYFCKKCSNYEVKSFSGQNLPCKFCDATDTQETANIKFGVSEFQLNEIYNLMDVYIHPFTSGGQEIPIQEAKLAELITLVTDYSCGQEMCEDGAHSLTLEWSSYREHDTEFIKASTCPKSISKQLGYVMGMSEEKRLEMGKAAREWAIENFSIMSLGPRIEKFLDGLEPTDYPFEDHEELREPDHIVPEIQDDGKWISYLYHNVLRRRTVDKDDDGHKYWMKEIENGIERPLIEEFFRKTAREENASITSIEITDFLDEDDEGRRMLYVMPQSIGDVFLSTSLFKSLKESYPDYNLYIATNPQNLPVLEANPYVHKVMPYAPQMDDLLWLEGAGDHRGLFEIAFLPYLGTQRIFDYQHNAKDSIPFNIKY